MFKINIETIYVCWNNIRLTITTNAYLVVFVVDYVYVCVCVLWPPETPKVDDQLDDDSVNEENMKDPTRQDETRFFLSFVIFKHLIGMKERERETACNNKQKPTTLIIIIIINDHQNNSDRRHSHIYQVKKNSKTNPMVLSIVNDDKQLTPNFYHHLLLKNVKNLKFFFRKKIQI